MTVSAETFSLSALLRSKSIDTKQIVLIDDNARLPSEELIIRVGLEYSISSIVTVDDDASIYSNHDPFMASTEFDLPTWELDVLAGDAARWGETKKGQESSLGSWCPPSSQSHVQMVAQVRRRPQPLPQLPRQLPSTSTGPTSTIKPARKLVSSSIIDETNAPSTTSKIPSVSRGRGSSSGRGSPTKPAHMPRT